MHRTGREALSVFLESLLHVQGAFGGHLFVSLGFKNSYPAFSAVVCRSNMRLIPPIPFVLFRLLLAHMELTLSRKLRQRNSCCILDKSNPRRLFRSWPALDLWSRALLDWCRTIFRPYSVIVSSLDVPTNSAFPALASASSIFASRCARLRPPIHCIKSL